MSESPAPAPVRITPSDPDWPARLEHVEDPPAGLWLRGDRSLLGAHAAVAIVGTRAPTPYGEAQARRFAASLARRGVAIVSGLARGVDSLAHAAALEADGASIAALGSGVDVPWPLGPVTDAMLARGLVVSEFPPGTQPRRHHFPLRNRIIAALANAVLVVEAAERSGSLITARWAVDLGLPVFAVPGRVDHPMARGTLALIREGATAVGSPEQLLEDLFGIAPGDGEGAHPEHDDPATWNALPRAIHGALEGETLDAGEIAARIDEPIGRVLAALVELELTGRLRRSPGGLYQRAR